MGVRYITKVCQTCGCEFQCISTWRRTQWCEECSALRGRYREIAHEISNRLAHRAMRDGRPCEECGQPGHTYHHIVPLADGGGVGLFNLRFLCFKCHDAKHHG